jgi:hypothetical protein
MIAAQARDEYLTTQLVLLSAQFAPSRWDWKQVDELAR